MAMAVKDTQTSHTCIEVFKHVKCEAEDTNLNISTEKVLRNVLCLQLKFEVDGICWPQSLPKMISCFGEVYRLWQTGTRFICQLLH